MKKNFYERAIEALTLYSVKAQFDGFTIQFTAYGEENIEKHILALEKAHRKVCIRKEVKCI